MRLLWKRRGEGADGRRWTSCCTSGVGVGPVTCAWGGTSSYPSSSKLAFYAPLLTPNSRRVPIYSISSLISLYSLDAAFFLDAIRDIYEAFVI